MPPHADRPDQTRRPPAEHGRLPADGSGRDVLGRMRALAESVRRQMAARRQNRARPGGPVGSDGGRHQ